MELRDKILRYQATMEEWIEWETRKRKTEFWGTIHEIEPVIHSEIFGDGKQLAYLGTIDQRPNYWLIRIDSSIDVNSDEFDFEEHLLQPLEDEFGRHPGFIVDKDEFDEMKKNSPIQVSEYEDFEDYKEICEYPRILWGGGHFGSLVNFKTNTPKVSPSTSQEIDA